MGFASFSGKKSPWLSLSLLLLTYITFGWIFSSSNVSWTIWLIKQGHRFGWFLDKGLVSGIVDLLGAILILLMAIILIAPIKTIRIFFGRWIQSDKKAFISVLAWAFAVVLIFCWLEQFIRFLVLLSSAILARWDLQIAGYNEWQAFGILSVLCLSGFGLGLLIFQSLGI